MVSCILFATVRRAMMYTVISNDYTPREFDSFEDAWRFVTSTYTLFEVRDYGIKIVKQE